MTSKELESAIVDELRTMGMTVNPFPEKPSGYVAAAYPCEVLVRYEGTDYPKTGLSTVWREKEQKIETVVVGQSLREYGGIYDTLDRIRERLDGFTLKGAGGYLSMESESFADEYNGTWQYVQKWKLKSRITNEQQDEWADRPLWTQEP